LNSGFKNSQLWGEDKEKCKDRKRANQNGMEDNKCEVNVWSLCYESEEKGTIIPS
jgi:hypothetical protein